MKTLKVAAGYKILLSSSGVLCMVLDNENHCIFTTSSERKAVNFLNRTLKDSGLQKVQNAI